MHSRCAGFKGSPCLPLKYYLRRKPQYFQNLIAFMATMTVWLDFMRNGSPPRNRWEDLIWLSEFNARRALSAAQAAPSKHGSCAGQARRGTIRASDIQGRSTPVPVLAPTGSLSASTVTRPALRFITASRGTHSGSHRTRGRAMSAVNKWGSSPAATQSQASIEAAFSLRSCADMAAARLAERPLWTL